MTKPSVINVNDIFGLTDDEKIEGDKQKQGLVEINISDLISFKNHPFKLYEGERLNDMVESIKEHGVITPLIVRPLESNKYEILSGHNRANSAKIAGLGKVPVVIKEDLTDEEAMLIVTETNVIQRSFSELAHSEKARVLVERHKAIKQQGRRTDLINEIENICKADDLEESSSFRQLGENHRSDVELADSYNISPRVVSRYIRIDTLINELKDRIDINEIPFMAGVDLSFLKEDEQEIVEAILDDYGFKVDLKKSEVLKTLSKGRNFNYDKAHEVLSGKFFDKPKKNKKTKFTSRFTKNIVEKYVTENRGISEVEKLIERLLEEHFSQNQEIENEDEIDME